MALFRILPLLAIPFLALGTEYQLCFLMDGPNTGKIDAERSKQLQAAHMEHIKAMWKSGALESAGPISGAPGARGIFLFSASAAETARLASADPKVIAGDLRLACHTWDGPAGVGKAYRDAAAKPDFAEKYTRKVGVLFQIVTPAPGLAKVRVSGIVRGSDYRYFALLDTDRLDAVKAKFPDALAFLWFHDERVWDSLEP